MAGAEVSFPKIASGNWWALREQFKKKIPTTVGPSYLSSVLGEMSVGSARSNIISPFRKIGILDEEGRPTDLANDWRDDDKYPEVCRKILEASYPEEVRDIFDNKDCDVEKLKKWFMSHARCGEPAAKMYARFYVLLLEADANNNAERKPQVKSTSNTKQPAKKSAKSSESKNTQPAAALSKQDLAQATDEAPHAAHAGRAHPPSRKAPELHINIQLHISPESSAEQIEKIFESMAKHLKDFN
ncbi:DUF5343 domain-containing protein [Pseudomonas sp. GV071]|uniref:DUF5343 domain-containing protein n=1 Tax=Pseudomonas sp. GV071 TaxID=2135754 RepID=UPI000D4651C6|nr:DUF5343 domain-containing protein [Pseudomonas sp. GV071]PTQ68160.1 hypothetical protein C8K61_11277 [Pseudomonas sp. GV071]